MRAAIYCRVVNQSQLSEECIKHQYDMLKELTQEQNHTAVCSAFDYDSGLDFKRKGLQKIREAVEVGSINAMMVKDISRIERDFIKTHEYLGYLRKYNVRVLQADILKRHL